VRVHDPTVRARLPHFDGVPIAALGVPMNAIDLLETDHRAIEGLMDELEHTTERALKTRPELFRKFRIQLTVHEVIEETIFYPALKEHPKARDIVLEGYEEHHVVDEVMAEIADTPIDDETWSAKAKVMVENVRHHIQEEEQDMFRKARAAFNREELEALGERMQRRKTDALLEQEAAIDEQMGKPASAVAGGAMA
jgi:hemerythrin-like domain-containing protein